MICNETRWSQATVYRSSSEARRTGTFTVMGGGSCRSGSKVDISERCLKYSMCTSFVSLSTLNLYKGLPAPKSPSNWYDCSDPSILVHTSSTPVPVPTSECIPTCKIRTELLLHRLNRRLLAIIKYVKTMEDLRSQFQILKI